MGAEISTDSRPTNGHESSRLPAPPPRQWHYITAAPLPTSMQSHYVTATPPPPSLPRQSHYVTTTVPPPPPPRPSQYYFTTVPPPQPPPHRQSHIVDPPQQQPTNNYCRFGQVTAFHSSSKWKAYYETALKSSNKLMVIEFTAAWCGPCRSMEPILNQLAAKYTDVEFVKIDVDELMDVATQFGVQVMPTFVFMRKGEQIDKVVGAKKEDLQNKIDKHILY